MLDQGIRERISALRALEQVCFLSRRRFAQYRYLAEVYGAYAQLRQDKAAKKALRRIARLIDIHPRRNSHPIRTLIDATSNADIKTKSRWTQALRYARRKRKKWTNVEDFFRANGGPAGCAAKLATLNPRPPRKNPAYAGGGGGPRVPLYIDHELAAL